MPLLRTAKPGDADEFLRLFAIMWDDFNFMLDNDDWHDAFRRHIATEPSDRYRITVAVDPDDETHLIAMGIGAIFKFTPAVWLPNGLKGFLQWFVTEPAWRGNGIGEKILQSLIEWMGENNVARVQLHAFKAAEPL